MSENEHPYTVRRCVVCALDWHDSDEFAKCERCGDPTERLNTPLRPPPLSDSRAQRNEIRVAQRDAIQAARQAEHLKTVQLERRITVASAAIRHDADKLWTAYDGDLTTWVHEA